MPCLLTARHRIKKETISVHRQCRRQAQSSHAGEYTVSQCDCFFSCPMCAWFDAYDMTVFFMPAWLKYAGKSSVSDAGFFVHRCVS